MKMNRAFNTIKDCVSIIVECVKALRAKLSGDQFDINKHFQESGGIYGNTKND